MARKKSILTSVVLIFIGIMMIGCSMEQSSEPRVPAREQFKEVKAAAVGAGYTFSIVVDKAGSVWACGDEISQFQRIEGLENIKAVSGWAEEFVALDNKGEVWFWDGDQEGSGDGEKEGWAAEPVKIKNLSAITVITGNLGTYLALKNDGTVYAWGGDNMYQQLGSDRDNCEPEPVPDLPPAISISCGGSYCAAVDQEGYVWVWGKGIDLNLRVIHGIYYPQKVSGMDHVVSVSCSMGGIIALRNDGSVWEWGDGDNPPHKIEGPEKVEKIFQGGFHGLCINKEGNLWTWGNNKKGQLGNGEAKWAYFPAAKVNGISNVVSISGGVRHTIVCLKDGSVWTWGDNSMGQLGNGTYENSSVPQKVLLVDNSAETESTETKTVDAEVSRSISDSDPRLFTPADICINKKPILGITYEQVLQDFGTPQKISTYKVQPPAVEDGVYEYFSVVSYDGIQFEFYNADTYKVEPSMDDTTCRFDLIGNSTVFDCGLRVGMTVHEVIENYGERKVYDLTSHEEEYTLVEIKHILTSRKPEEMYAEYEKAMYITADYQKFDSDIIAMGLVLLIKDNKVERIVFGYPTAD